jgi:hypothetical protein
MLEFKEMRWWPLEELRLTKQEVAPRNLANLIYDLLEKGIPTEPIEVGP